VADRLIDRERLADRLEDLQDRIPLPPDFERPDAGGRLGATVQSLTPQLAEYFGVKTGVLVSAVAANTPAARAGVKAGDVIRTVNQNDITSRGDLLRTLREVGGGGEVALGIVRDKKESRLTVTLDAPGLRRGRPARFTRGV
jgi:serine protease Do